MRADMDAERARMFKRYVASKRHTMQVDYDDYLADLVKERRRGAERARAVGNRLPVPPGAAEAAAA
jgi:dimethylaniline monooxygenase (N-oxide forming)